MNIAITLSPYIIANSVILLLPRPSQIPGSSFPDSNIKRLYLKTLYKWPWVDTKKQSIA